MLSSCFNFTSAYLSVYVNHDIVSLSVRHVVDVCCLIKGALTNREMVGERATWGKRGWSSGLPVFQGNNLPSVSRHFYQNATVNMNNVILRRQCCELQWLEEDTPVPS